MTQRTFTIVYFTIAVIEIFADLSGIRWLVYCTKPLLMFSLSAFYVQQTTQKMDWQDKAILAGFAFSLFGDIFLMIPKDLFIFGLGSFLVAHLCYIFAFSFPSKMTILGRLGFLTYALIFVIFLKKHLPTSLFLPILVYAFTIATMGMRAAERRTNPQSFQWVLVGAILFIISDSLIAIAKFVQPIPAATLFVMGTYVVAQYLIAVGFLKRITT